LRAPAALALWTPLLGLFRPKPKEAPRFTLQIQLDAEGKISAIYSVLGTRKLTQLLRPT
jgi:hypothetical protein